MVVPAKYLEKRVVSQLVSLTFHALAHQLADTAGRFGGFTGPSLRWFFERTTVFHFPEQAFALHFLLQYAQGLVDIIIPNSYKQCISLSRFVAKLTEF